MTAALLGVMLSLIAVAWLIVLSDDDDDFGGLA